MTRPATGGALATLVLGGFLSLAGCSPQAGSTTPETAPQTFVRVVNRNFLDMDVYVLVSGEATRLGTVTSLTTQVLPLPGGLVAAPTNVRFRASPVGSPASAASWGVYANPGDTLHLEIPNGSF